MWTTLEGGTTDSGLREQRQATYLLEGIHGPLQDKLGLTERDLLIPLDTGGVKRHLGHVELSPVLQVARGLEGAQLHLRYITFEGETASIKQALETFCVTFT